jgi:hypothetical protein
MKRIIKLQNILAICGLALIFCGCNRDKVFEKEQYKHVFSLVTHEDTYNVFNMEVHLGNDITDGCVSAYVGGTNPTTEDIKIVMTEDPELAATYKEAQLLPSNCYKIDNYNMTIPAGEHECQMNIKLMPEGIAPDSAWFIPLKISSYIGGELNNRKCSVLYRVLIKNRFATQASTTIYQMKGQIAIGDREAPITMNKEMKPLGKRKVRINAGSRVMQGNSNKLLSFLQNETIVVEVTGPTSMSLTDSVKVKVLPYTRNIEVTQIDTVAAYSNIFKITTELSAGGKIKYYKNFRLHYWFRLASGVEETVKEDLRLEFRPEDEKDADYK